MTESNETLGTVNDWRKPAGASRSSDGEKVYHIPFKAALRGTIQITGARNKKAAFAAARRLLKSGAASVVNLHDEPNLQPLLTIKKQSIKTTKK